MIQSKKRKEIRLVVFGILSLLVYISFFIFLFLQKEVLLGALFFVLYHLLFSFVALDEFVFSRKSLLIVLGSVGLLLCLCLPEWNWQSFVAVWISLLSIPLFFYQRRQSLTRGKSLHMWAYFSGGTSVFILIFSAIFWLSMLGNFQTLPFSCEEVSNLTSSLSLHATRQQSMLTDGSENWLRTNIASTFSTTKDLLWDNVLATQKKINYQVCMSIFDQLTSLYQMPAFQVAFLFALYMLSFGVMRFSLQVIAGIGVVIFWCCAYFGRYKIEKKIWEIEQID